MVGGIQARGRPVIVGEVLFDRFPDDVEVLGGAPFNVAWHLQGFGLAPLLMSRVGKDDRGQRVRDAMQEWGMDLSGMEVDPSHPTGVVEIVLSGAGHAFDILSSQAYDFTSLSRLDEVTVSAAGLLYHGSLIMRTRRMRDRLNRIQRQSLVPKFVDLNLREPWWSSASLEHYLRGAVWVKCNDSELEALTRQCNCFDKDICQSAGDVRRILELDLLIVTLGKDGALAFPRNGEPASVQPDQVITVSDTVGAGDAFAAVAILGLLHQWQLETILRRAQSFAGEIVQRRGATCRERELYDRMSVEWGLGRSAT